MNDSKLPTKIVFATRNEGKLREIRQFFQGTRYEILSLDDAQVNIEVVEDGATFAENAVKKATEVCNVCGMLTLADDSGLEIDILNGVPGVNSASFLGKNTPYDIRNSTILEMLDGLPPEMRGARFVCVIAIAQPGRDVLAVRSRLEGQIALEPAGGGGFGYDPIFYVPELKMTTAQLNVAQKNKISHRGRALALALAELQKI